ncbi:MAG: D-alanyl-D-alanine carboxypeptidase family protein [bacterium]
MSFRAKGLLLVALYATFATMAEAAPAPVVAGPPEIAARATTSTAATKRKRRTTRSRRRTPPPGGVYARNAILLDPTTGEVLFEKNAARSVPIASITKLMTAMVFLEQQPDLEREVEVTATDLAGAGHTQLRRGEHVPLGELLHMSLMCSDNCATRVLARESGLTHDEFIGRMNRKAVELGLTGSRFTEFTGLDERNVSTASDVARMVHAAAHEPLMARIMTTRSHEFRTARRAHAINNTNRLLYSRYEILGGKTGFIMEAGYCFATWVRAEGRDLIAVVLGAPTGATRFADTVRLIQKAQQPTATASKS